MYLSIFSIIIFIFLLGAQIMRSFLANNSSIANEKNSLNPLTPDARLWRADNGLRFRLGFGKFFHLLLQNQKKIFLSTIFIVFALLFYQSYLQYQTWFSDEFSKHLLYQETGFGLPFSVNYFVFYVGTRFFAPYLISLAAALLFLIFAKKLNKKYDERFFYEEEPWFGALAFFLLGHPGWLFYFALIILIYFIVHLLSLVISRKSLVISLYYWWFPTAIFVILIQRWLELLSLWKLLIF